MISGNHDGATLARWLWHGYLRRHLWLVLAATFLMAIEGGMLGALSFMVRPMFDEVFVGGNRDAVFWVAGIVFVLFLFRAGAGFGQRVLMSVVSQKTAAALQRGLVGHMLGLDSGFFKTNSPGLLIERVRGDTTAASRIWGEIFSTLGRDAVALLSLLAVAVSIDWVATLVALAGAPLLVLPVVLLQRVVRRKSREARNAAAGIATRLDEMFHGIDTIKLNATEDRETTRFHTETGNFVNAEIKSLAARAGILGAVDIVAGIGFFGVLAYGGLQIIDDQKTVGEFMSFFTAMALVFEPLRRLGNISGAWQVALTSMERLYAVFEVSPTIVSPGVPKSLSAQPAQADIVFDNVSLSYGDKPVLRQASFVAKAGKTTALVGASGAGKSTVFNVLTRLIEPQSGHVSIGGTAIADLDLVALRALFSVVTQDTQLFDETVRDNVLLGRNASHEELEAVLKAAHVADFLPNLARGVDTPAGPRGSALSGGQRQRIAIARALFRDTPILLLDEATSALDAKSEAQVQSALDRLAVGRTTLVIAHRLATIRSADHILVMDQGQVVDQGTHPELLKRKGIYADLCRLQFQPED